MLSVEAILALISIFVAIPATILTYLQWRNVCHRKHEQRELPRKCLGLYLPIEIEVSETIEPLETDNPHMQYMKPTPYIPHANKSTKNINSTWFPFKHTAGGNLAVILDANI